MTVLKPRIKLLPTLAFLLIMAPATAIAQSYSTWTYNRTINFNTTATGANIATPVTNFPLLVRLDASNFNFSQAATDGSDIRFEEAGHTVPLSYEIERWDFANQVAEIWVLVPQVDANSNTDYIYMFWGKAGATSESTGPNVFPAGNGFGAAWHLAEDGTNTGLAYKDASGNANHGTGANMTNTSDVAGIIGIASNFIRTSSQAIQASNASTLHGSSALTLEAWVKPATQGIARKIIHKPFTSAASPWNEYSLELQNASGTPPTFTLTLGGTEMDVPATTQMVNGSWYHIVGVYDGSAQKIYVNGVLENSVARSGTISNYGMPLGIGKNPVDASQNFDGAIDEPRVSTVARSADWIKLSYANQNPIQSLIFGATKIASVTGNWNSTATWGGGAVPAASDYVIVNSGVTVTLTADVSLPGALTLNGAGSVQLNGFNLTVGALDAGGGSSSIVNSGAARTLTLTSNTASANFAGVLAGAISLVKSGLGVQTLGGSNSYSGHTTVNAGILKLGSPTALGTTSDSTNVNDGATLDLNGQTIGNEAVTLYGTGVDSIGALTNSNGAAASISGKVTGSWYYIGGNGSITLGGSMNNGGNSYANKIGSNTLTITGTADNGLMNLIAHAGTVVLAKVSGGSVHAIGNGLTVDGGTVKFGGSGGDQIANTSGVLLSNGTLDMNGMTETMDMLTGGGILTNTNGSSSASLTLGSGNGSYTFSGTIQNTGLPLSLGKMGTGTQTFTGSNTFTGGYTHTDGITLIGSNTALGTGPVTMSGAGQFQLSGGVTVANMLTIGANSPGSGLGTVQGPTGTSSATWSGSISILQAAATGGHFNGGNATNGLTFSGSVTASSGLPISIRANRVTLSGSGSYDSLRISGGTVILGAANAISTSAVVDLGSSAAATLELNGYSQTLGGLTRTAAQTTTVTNSSGTAATLTLGFNTKTYAYDGDITGNLSLVKSGSGTQALGGSNTYSGTTTLNAGIIRLNSAGALGSTAAGTLVLSGASLDLNGVNYSASEALTLNGTGVAGIGALVNSNATGATYGGLITLGSASSVIGESGTINISNANAIAGSYSLTLGGTQGGSFAGTLSGGILAKQNAGTWTLSGSSGLNLGSLTLSAGTLNLGTALTHTLSAAPSISGGTLNFGSSTLQVTATTANFASLSGVTAGTGTLEFTGGSTQTFTPKTSATFPNIIQSGAGTTVVAANLTTAGLSISNGTLDIAANSAALTVSGNLSMTGGVLSAGSGYLNITGNASVTTGTLTCPVSGAFNVAGNVSIGASATLNPNGGTLTLNGTVSGKLLSIYPSLNNLIVNGNAGTWSANHNLTATGAVTVSNGTLDIDSYAVSLAANALTVNGGTLTAPGGNISVGSDFAMSSGSLSAPGNGQNFSVAGSFLQSGGTFTPNAGTVTLNGNATGKSINNASQLNVLSITGTGAWTATGSGLKTSSLSLGYGTLNLGAALIDMVGSTLTFNNAPTLDFGSSTLRFAGPALDLNAVGTLNSGTGTLEFNGASAQSFTPPSGANSPGIKQSGTGTTSIIGYDLTTPSLAMSSGTLSLGSGNHSVSSSVSITGGTLDFGSATLSISAANVDFHLLAGLTPGSGMLVFTGGSAQTFAIPASLTFPPVRQNGAGGTTLSTNGLTTSTLSVYSGTLHLGSGLSHSAAFFNSAGGSLDFGSSTLHLTGYGNTQHFESLSSITPGTGALSFDAASNTQTFTATSAGFPDILHPGAGTLLISSTDLHCKSFTSSNGPLTLSGTAPAGNITTVAGFSITNGNSATFTGLNAHTLTVGGATVLSGATAADKLNLNPGSAWTLAASGSVAATFATLGDGNASINPGVCTDCEDATGNTNWIMPVSWKGGGGSAYWNNASNWNSNLVPTANQDVIFNATNANASLNGNRTVHSIAFTNGYTGTFDFGSYHLAAGGNVDLRSGGPVTAASGTLEFIGTTTQNFYPAPSTPIGVVIQSGSSVTTVQGSAGMQTDSLLLSAGTVNLGTGMSHTVGSISGGGALDFGGSGTVVYAKGNVDLHNITMTTSAGHLLVFSGANPQVYDPRTGVNNLSLKQDGAGGTTVHGQGFTTPSLTIASGTLNLGASALMNTVSSTLTVTGGGLDFGSATLKMQGSVLNLSALSVLVPGTGTLEFNPASALTFTPKTGVTFPSLKQSSGTTTLADNLTGAGTLFLYGGTFNLGTSLAHSFQAILSSGGSLDFGSSILYVTLGNADFSTLGALTPSSGTLVFNAPSGAQIMTLQNALVLPAILHAGAGTLQLAGADLDCHGFTQSAGSLDLNGRNVTTSNVTSFMVTNGTGASLIGLQGRTLTITGNASFIGTSSASRINLNPGAVWNLALTGTLSASDAILGYSTVTGTVGVCSNCVDASANINWSMPVVWDGGGSGSNWTTAANWSSDSVPTANQDIIFNATSTKAVTLDANIAVKNLTMNSGYTGLFDFNGHNLTLSGNGDFRTGGTVSTGTGKLTFSGANPQTLYYPPGSVSVLAQNGAGGTTILGSQGIAADTLILSSGTLNLGTGLTHQINGPVSGSGGLNFGGAGTMLYVKGDVNLLSTTITAGASHHLRFNGTGAQSYSANGTVPIPNIGMYGTGTLTLAKPVIAATLTLNSGTLNLGASWTHTVSTTLTLTAGNLVFGSSTMEVQAATADFSALTSITPGNGLLKFTGTSAQTFKPLSGATYPNITQYGTGGTTVIGNGLITGTLTLNQGTFNLGVALSHTLITISDGGGGPYGNLNFGSSLAHVSGNVSLGNVPTLTAGTGTLDFNGSGATQLFTPKGSAATHPIITHSGADTVRVYNNPLYCLGFSQTAGTWDFNGQNLNTVGAGNLSVTNGSPSSFANLAGRTLTIAGNANLTGQSANHLALNPGAAWSIGAALSLHAMYADIGNSTASNALGNADSCQNLGTNGFWLFHDNVKPNNVTAFLATAQGGHSAVLSWTGSSSPDGDSVMLRYRTDGQYPTGPADGSLWRTVAKTKSVDTATGIPDKTIFNFAAFARDSSGNYALPVAAAQDTAVTPDVTPPANVTAFTVKSLGPTTAELSWTPSASADADSVIIRYRLDGPYPTGIADAALFKTVSASRSKDTATGLQPDRIFFFGAFARDSSANYAAAAASAQDTVMYQTIVTGSVAITDLSGRTRDIDPALAFTYSNADSMRFSLWADTATAPWTLPHALDSLNMAAGADGARIVAAQFKSLSGVRSPWYRDTTLLDRAAPVVTLALNPTHSWRNWPNAIAGKALDAVGGTDSVFVVRRRQSDGAYFNGSGWTTVADTAKLRVDSTFSVPMPGSALVTGNYDFTAYARDKVGNVSAPMTVTVAYQENRAPSLASSGIADSVRQNQSVAWNLDLGDPDVGDSVLTVTSSIPTWLTLSEKADSAGGGFAAHRKYTLTGTPLQANVGNTVITIQGRDLGGQTFTFTKTVPVIDVNDPPIFLAGQDSAQAVEDSVIKFTPKYTDADPSDVHTLALLQAPAWVTIADSNLVFRPGSRDVGSAHISLTVSDGKILDTLDMTVKVANVNDPPVAFPGDAWQSPAHWKEDAVDKFTVVVVDMDQGDPVTLTTALPAWLSYTATIDSASPYNHFFRFTAAPGQKDTGTYSFKFHFRDAAGTFSELPLTAYVAAVNDTPTALIKGQQSLAGAARITLDVTDEDGSAAATRFHYRLISAAGDTVRKGICASTLLDLHPLADGDYRLAVAAEDEGGLKQAGFTSAVVKISGATTLALDSARWNMIGYPGRALAAAALGAGSAITTWSETSDGGSPSGSYSAARSVDSLARGKGYWVRVAKPVGIKAPLAELLDGPFTLKLTHGKQGWNQIGNPYPYFIDLSASGLQFWEWDAARRDLSDAHGILKPWGAYWVQVRKDTTVILKDDPYFPAAAGQGASGPLAKGASLSPAFNRAGDWTLQLALQAGPYQDQANFLGIRDVTGAARAQGAGAGGAGEEDGGNGMASLIPDPPKFGDYIALHFEKPGEKSGDGTGRNAADSLGLFASGYASDFRDSLGKDEEWWDFSVENSGSGLDKASLSLPGLKALETSGLHAFLVRKGETLPVTSDAPAVLAMEGATTHYSLVVTPHADFAERLQGKVSVSQNFPNPVTSLTTFRFYLPETWDASGKREAKTYRLRLNVYDFSGRLAAQVVDGGFKPGSHTLIWQPQTKGGGALAKGAYAYRLEIPGFAKTLKLLIK